MSQIRHLLVLLPVMALLVAACNSVRSGGEHGVQIVVTTPILGDIVSQIVGDSAGVTVLMPNGADPHDYRASSSQVAQMAEADLIVLNGLGLEEGMADVITELEDDGANVLEVGLFADPLTLDGEPCVADASKCDPHVWLDPVGMFPVIGAISDRLVQVFPSADWEEGRATYHAELASLHAEVSEMFLAVQPEKRKLVTTHDFLGYFARRYVFESVGSVIPGGSTLAVPSSAHLAELVAAMDAETVEVIFAEGTDSDRLARSVGDALGREVPIVHLHIGSLGEPGSGAETYVGMLRTNAELIIEALS